MITQLSFISDNDHEPRIRRASVPVAKQDARGRWCWLVSGTDTYQHEPALEAILIAALARQQRKAA